MPQPSKQAIGRFKGRACGKRRCKIAKGQAFGTKLFDCNYLHSAIEKNQYYEKTDEDGDIRLLIPANNRFMYELFAWVVLKPYRITIDSGVRGITMSDTLERNKSVAPQIPSLKFKSRGQRATNQNVHRSGKVSCSRGRGKGPQNGYNSLSTNPHWHGLPVLPTHSAEDFSQASFQPRHGQDSAEKKKPHYKKTNEEEICISNFPETKISAPNALYGYCHNMTI